MFEKMEHAEHANLVLADDVITGLKEALSGAFVSDDGLDEALGVTPARRQTRFLRAA